MCEEDKMMQKIVDKGAIKHGLYGPDHAGKGVPRGNSLSVRGEKLQPSRRRGLRALGTGGRFGSVRKVGEVHFPGR